MRVPTSTLGSNVLRCTMQNEIEVIMNIVFNLPYILTPYTLMNKNLSKFEV
jgi:hypothetical protein